MGMPMSGLSTNSGATRCLASTRRTKWSSRYRRTARLATAGCRRDSHPTASPLHQSPLSPTRLPGARSASVTNQRNALARIGTTTAISPRPGRRRGSPDPAEGTDLMPTSGVQVVGDDYLTAHDTAVAPGRRLTPAQRRERRRELVASLDPVIDGARSPRRRAACRCHRSTTDRPAVPPPRRIDSHPGVPLPI